jgi:hypothetical protein
MKYSMTSGNRGQFLESKRTVRPVHPEVSDTHPQHVVGALQREGVAADGEGDGRQARDERAVEHVLAEGHGRGAQRAVERSHLRRGPAHQRRARVRDRLAPLQPRTRLAHCASPVHIIISSVLY